MQLNDEKLKILQHNGDTLVVANPGTGKTLLLAHKYVRLIKSGVKPEDILCLTFTNKAKTEMEERILRILKEEKQVFDLSKLNVYTFHSYALDAIGQENTIPSNLLRYSIYKYFVENKILNYEDAYLIEKIVPKMENLIRYLKSFGIMPDQINIVAVKKLLSEYKSLSKEEMDKFAEVFVDVYKHYEDTKKGKGIDYADMLLEFLKLKVKPKFKHVLVDELQDVNKMEADIALESGETFFAVGDKKQAIFGFQGGSIGNFEKFKKAKVFVLSENFRSTNEILNYAKEFFVSRTKDKEHKENLKNLRNEEGKSGPKPFIYAVSKDDNLDAICELVKKLREQNKQVAVIARTNLQIMRISGELQKRGIEHSSTYFAASNDARTHVINFIRGLLSNDISDVRNAMFTPFFPISLQDAFDLTEIKNKDLTMQDIYKKSPGFKAIRQSVNTVEDVNKVFKAKILPIAIAHGKEYLLAALTIHEAFNESIKLLDDISLTGVLAYLKSSDLLTNESEIEHDVVLTSIHKAKGRQFKCVIYAPTKPRDSDNFQDQIVKTVLKTKSINAEEELNEEALRIDFVAITRAEEELHILPDKIENYLNACAQEAEIKIEGLESFDSSDRMKRAYNLFLNGEVEKSKKLLEDKHPWIKEYAKKHFEGLDHISFSSLQDSPENYLLNRILTMREFSSAADLGSQVHAVAESIFSGKEYELTEELKPYRDNVQSIMQLVMKQYPEKVAAEHKMNIPLEQLIGEGQGLMFTGIIDAIFKNKDQYLILDWKTDKKEDDDGKHRQQLETYKRAYSISANIPLDKIKIAIAFIGLRTTVNLGRIECKLDDKQPGKTSFETFKKKVHTVIEWKNNPELFLQQLNASTEDLISLAVQEEYQKEIEPRL